MPIFLNVGLQRQSASIAEMIPSILSCWESIKLKTSENGRISCDYLIEDFKKKILLNIQASTEIQLDQQSINNYSPASINLGAKKSTFGFDLSVCSGKSLGGSSAPSLTFNMYARALDG